MNKTTIVYKLTDKNSQTRNNTQWGPNVTHTTHGQGKLCSSGWLHAYHHPLLAVLLNSAHGNFDAETMKLWKCKGIVGIREADKLGCTELTTLEEIKIPQVTTTQRCAFAILTAQQIYRDKSFRKWAKDWLSGKDRTIYAAAAGAYATNAATYYAAAYATNAAAYAATYAAYAATNATNAATNAAATYAAYYATYAAATNATYAAEKLTDKKLLRLAKKAIKGY